MCSNSLSPGRIGTALMDNILPQISNQINQLNNLSAEYRNQVNMRVTELLNHRATLKKSDMAVVQDLQLRSVHFLERERIGFYPDWKITE